MVPSAEPSSTTTSCWTQGCRRTRWRTRPRVGASLKAGTITARLASITLQLTARVKFAESLPLSRWTCPALDGKFRSCGHVAGEADESARAVRGVRTGKALQHECDGAYPGARRGAGGPARSRP